MLDAFIAVNREKLVRIYRDYADDDRNPMLMQPESLLVFERLEHDRFRLVDQWLKVLPMTWIEQLADIWGKPVLMSS